MRLKYLARLNTKCETSEARPVVALENLDSWTGALVSGVELPIKDPASANGIATVEPGDILFGKLRPYLAKTWLAERQAYASTELLCLRPSAGVSSRWLAYLMSSRPVVDWAVATSDGTKMPRTSWEALGEFRVSLPGEATQEAIGARLDRETAQLAALITAKRRIIELLEERYRTSLDEVFAPYEGRVAPLGRFVISIAQGASPEAENRPAENGEWGVLKLSAVKNGRFISSENKALPGNPTPDGLAPAVGDLLVTRSNTPAYVGDACAVTVEPGRVMLPDLIYRLRLDARLNPEYAAAALLRTRGRFHLSATARGTSQSMVKLRGEDVKAAPIPVLDPPTQASLIARLNVARVKNDGVIEALARQIGLLAERRQAVITAAVIGQPEIARVSAA